MRHRTGIFVLWGALGAIACGGASTTDFSNPVGAGGTATNGGSGAQGGTSDTGGSSSGKGGSTSSGGSVNTGGSSGTSGTAGDAAGGTTGGTDATGGTTDTGGTDAAGGSGATAGTNATGGSDAAGGSGATAGTDATGGTTDTGGTGGTGMATGGSAGSGMQTGGSGGMGPDCNALEMDYSMTLEQAEACNPNSGKDQCTQMEKSDLVCGGCTVFVNPDNQAAIMHLDELRQEAGSNCVHPCPAIACVVPSSTCTATMGSKSAGRCTSQLATPL